MADPDSLSPDQLDKVMQFQEVSGCTDVCICVAALTAADWEVEAAVHQHLTHASQAPSEAEGAAMSHSSSESEVRRRAGGSSSALSEQDSSHPNPQQTSSSRTFQSRSDATSPDSNGAPPARPVAASGTRSAAAVLPVRPGLLRRLADWAVFLGFSLPSKLLVRWPIKFCFWSIQSLFSVAYSILYSASAAPDPARDMSQFVTSYETTYPGVAHPPFYSGSYTQALSLAKQRLQFLLVYLHCADHLSTHTFCRRVLSDARLLNYIATNNILFWACDVSLPEGYRVSQALRENDYPYLALVVLRGSRMSVVARLEGQALLDPQHVVDTLSRHHDSSMPYVTAARLSRLEREQAVALRQEQDTAYQASLRADREKARLRQQQLLRVEEDALREQRREQEEKDRKQSMKECIPQEPAADSPGALQLVVKLPHGERLERRFHVDHPLSALYCLVYTHEHAPDRFEVTTNFPRKVVPCRPPAQFSETREQPITPQASPKEGSLQQQDVEEQEGEEEPLQQDLTFGQFGIAPRTVLFVKDLDA